MGTFEIDDPAIDVEAFERRVREAIEAKRGVRFSDEELAELRSMRLEPRLRREDLPRGWLREMPEVRSQLRPIQPPAGHYVRPAEALYETRSGGLKGALLRVVRRLMRPLYRLTSNLEGTLTAMVEDHNVRGEWLSDVAGQLDRWRERDLHLYHNLVYELTSLRLQQTHMQDRINELIRRLDMLAERERAFESLALGGDVGLADAARARPASEGSK